IFRATITSGGGAMNVTLQDTATGAIASQFYSVDVAGVLRNPIGWVGFTGATGGLSATQDILNWHYTAPPAFANYMGLSGRSPSGFGYPGPGLSISSSGTRNGILSAVQADGYGSG